MQRDRQNAERRRRRLRARGIRVRRCGRMLQERAERMERPMSATETTSSPTGVLVHGAFADASSWAGVITELESAGVRAVAPPNLLRGIDKDSAYLTSYVDQLDGPVLLVGHSYGGALITQTGADAHNVVGLVFVS